MLNWATATHEEICGNISETLEKLRKGESQNVTMSYYTPESTYRLLSFEKRLSKVRKGPGKGQNRAVYVMRRG